MKVSSLVISIGILLTEIFVMAQGSYIEFHRQIFDAITVDRFEEKNKFDSLIWAAYRLYPRNPDVPLPYWFQAVIISSFSEKDSLDAIQFIIEHPVYTAEEKFLSFVCANENLVFKYQQYYGPSLYYHKDHLQLSAFIDTLIAIDQISRKNNSKKYERFINERNIKHTKDIAASHINLLNGWQTIIDRFGLVASFSCESCGSILALLTHIDDYDFFVKHKDYLMSLVEQGYLAPGIFSYIADRCYAELAEKDSLSRYRNGKGTLPYYNGIVIESFFRYVDRPSELDSDEIIVINRRRSGIGIPPLPFNDTGGINLASMAR